MVSRCLLGTFSIRNTYFTRLEVDCLKVGRDIDDDSREKSDKIGRSS